MRRFAVRSLLARPTRLLLTALAVALGVTLITGTYVFTDTINGAFDRIFTESYRGTDAVITPRTSQAGHNDDEADVAMDASVLPTVRRTAGVATAEGGIFSPGATILGKDGKPVGLGGAPRFIASTHPTRQFSVFSLDAGRLPRTADEVAIIRSTVDKEGFRIGDEIAIQAETPKRDYRMVGVIAIAGVDSFGGATVAMFTLPEAQRLAGKVGKFDEIDASARQGVPPARLKLALRRALPRTLVVRTGTEQAASRSKDIRDNLGFLRAALLAFAGIALFVGAFIIFNTFSITVAQRTREFALLRTLGAKRGQILRNVLGEGLAVGLLGAGAGLGLGILTAQGIRALFEAVGASLPSSGTVIASRTVVVSLLVGTLVTLLSSLVPALRATRVAPVAALREGAVLPPGRGARFVRPCAVLLSAGAVVLLSVGLFADLRSGPALSFVGAGAAAAFIGVALLSPRFVGPLAAFVARPFERLSALTGRLARENAVRQPGRTAATAAALMIGVTMFAFASIFAASAKSTIRQAVDAGLAADLVIENDNGFSPFTPQAARAVARLPGVDGVSAVRFIRVRANGTGRSVIGIDPRTFGDLYRVDSGAGALAALRPGTTVVSKKLSDDQGIGPGDAVTFRRPAGGTVDLTVTGVADDKGLLRGDFTVTIDELEKSFNIDKDGFVFVSAPRDAARVKQAVKRLLDAEFPQVKVLARGEFSDEFAGRIDKLLTLIYALLALTVIVALFGIVNTLVLSITERTRELGMLRAIGTSRRQIRVMIRIEAVIIGLIGGILGILLGTGLALLVSRTVDDLTLSLPIGTMLALLILAAVAGVIASVVPARRAARLDVLQALAYE